MIKKLIQNSTVNLSIVSHWADLKKMVVKQITHHNKDFLVSDVGMDFSITNSTRY